MARYRLTFEVTPAVAIKTELNVALGPEISATFKPQTREDSYGNPVPCGLDGTCTLSAETVDDASSKGIGIVETLRSIMSLAEGVGIPRARPLVVYDASPNVVDRDFRQYYHPPHSAVSRGTLHIDRFQDLVHSLSEVGDVDLAARVNRAMLWYRGALADVDPLERFARYWLVLETMNPRLREVLASERFRHKCPSCGHTWSYDGIDGVKKLFHTRIRDGDRMYRKANDIRNGLQHGFRSLADLRLEAGEVLPSVREAALKSILVVLGSEDTALSMLTKEISVITP